MNRRILPDHLLYLVLCRSHVTEIEKIHQAFPDIVDRSLILDLIRNFIKEAESSNDELTKVVSGFCKCILEVCPEF
jgi:hypothetical protein